MSAVAIDQQQTTASTGALDRLRAAQALLRTDRRAGMSALDTLFREGRAVAVDGRCAGSLVALDLAPGLTSLVGALIGAWMPWQGKTFDRARATGDNIFDRSAWVPAHILWPFYRGYVDDGARTYRAFAFHTYIAPGIADPDLSVLKIDYDQAGDPATIRRVLDELVEIEPNVYLGKAHLTWWWGKRQMVAFFLLRQPA